METFASPLIRLRHLLPERGEGYQWWPSSVAAADLRVSHSARSSRLSLRVFAASRETVSPDRKARVATAEAGSACAQTDAVITAAGDRAASHRPSPAAEILRAAVPVDDEGNGGERDG